MTNPIDTAIRQQGRTRRQVYTFLGVSAATLSRWIHGEQEPPVGQAIRLATLLNMTVEELFGHFAWGRAA